MYKILSSEWGVNTSLWPVKGMHLVRELEKDLKVANVICMVSGWFCGTKMCIPALSKYTSNLVTSFILLKGLEFEVWLLILQLSSIIYSNKSRTMILSRFLAGAIVFVKKMFIWWMQNGRRHLNSSRNEVSRDLIVTTNSRRKQALLVLHSLWNP